MIVFHHIPRTGGTTIARLLMDCLGADHVYQWTHGNGYGVPNGTRAAFGHFPFGVHKAHARYTVSVVRDPALRLKSQWKSIKREPRHFLHDRVQGMTFAEYVRSGAFPGLDNGMTRLLAGRSIYDDFGAVTGHDLDAAKRNVRRLSFVGITRKLGDLCDELGAALGCECAPGKRYNETGLTICVGPDRALVEQRNPYDVELYEYVRGVVV